MPLQGNELALPEFYEHLRSPGCELRMPESHLEALLRLQAELPGTAKGIVIRVVSLQRDSEPPGYCNIGRAEVAVLSNSSATVVGEITGRGNYLLYAAMSMRMHT